jgi:hypothetical protein
VARMDPSMIFRETLVRSLGITESKACEISANGQIRLKDTGAHAWGRLEESCKISHPVETRDQVVGESAKREPDP